MAEFVCAIDSSAFSAYRSPSIRVQEALSSWQKQRYFALRREVFAREQKILSDQEQDGDDFRASPIIALAASCGMADDVVGAVRIFQANDHDEPGLWFGGRLCVARDYRRYSAIGKGLVNEAVSRARDLGCRRFLANVQVQNEAYFHSLHWRTLAHITIADRPHALMQAELSAYPFMERDA
jgi:putative N-acetyltransferase (TIGR04045 family)